MKKTYTFNNLNNSHTEITEIERIIRLHIAWAVNNKDRDSLFLTIIDNEELFFFQPESKDTIIGIKELKTLVDELFMPDDFKAIRTEIHHLRIHMSTGLRTAWFSCLLNDYNEYKGKPFIWENVRWTGVLEKVEEKWKIFQMHFSKAEDLIR